MTHGIDVTCSSLGHVLIATSRRCVAIALILLVSSCVTLTLEPRALLLQDDGSVRVQSLVCGGPSFVEPVASEQTKEGRQLDPASIRLLTWNIHKEGDAGWQTDLRGFVGTNDLVLLQENVLGPELRSIVEDAGMRWVMASSVMYGEKLIDIGVLTAARTAPLASCTQRVVEPLIRIPKSAVISWFRLRGKAETLAVVNVHAINFSLLLGAYKAQLDALADALASHSGPIIFAGDLNTWTDARTEALRETAGKVGLTEIAYPGDKRKVFFGKQLDHVLVRGLETVASTPIAVTSSDHNPVQVTLRVVP